MAPIGDEELHRCPSPGDAGSAAASWHALPWDILACVVEQLLRCLRDEKARPAAEVTAWLAAIRAVCSPWRHAVDGCLAELRLRAVPRDAFLARFPALRSLDLTSLSAQLCDGAQGVAAEESLAQLLRQLPHVALLRSLALPECSAAALEPALALLQVGCCLQPGPALLPGWPLSQLSCRRHVPGRAKPGRTLHASWPQGATHLHFGPGSSAAAEGGAWPMHLPAADATAPLRRLSRVSCTDTSPDYAALARLPSLRELQLRSGRRRSGYGPSASLAGIRALGQLRRLRADQYFCSEPALAEVCQLGGLTHLDLSRWGKGGRRGAGSRQLQAAYPARGARLGPLGQFSCMLCRPGGRVGWVRVADAALFSRRSFVERLPGRALSGLAQLQELALCRCRLEELPAEVAQLGSLRALDLSYNAGLRLPAEAAQLRGLTQLLLDWTSAEVLEPVLQAQGRGQARPAQLWPALQELSLRSNALERFPLPAAACTALGALTRLELGVNALRAVPAEAALLRGLRCLGLRLNELQAGGLPPELGQLQALRELDVSGNTGLAELPDWCRRVARVDARWTGCAAVPPG
jgi:hypothetical protein